MLSTTVYADAVSDGGADSGTLTPLMICQRCRLPLTIHESLDNMDSTQSDQGLSSSAPTTSDEQKLKRQTGKSNFRPIRLEHFKQNGHSDYSGTATTDNAINKSPQNRFHGPAGTESFVLLTESQVVNAQPASKPANYYGPQEDDGPKGTYETMMARYERSKNNGTVNEEDESDSEIYSLSNRFKVSDKLFDVVTARTDIEQPICSECMELLVEGLKQQYIEIVRDRDAYANFLKQVQTEKPSPEVQQKMEKELVDITKEQEELMLHLKKREQEREKIRKEIEELEAQSQELQREEERFWKARNQFASELEEFLNERDSVKAKYSYDNELLEKLRKTNVYSDIFAIEGGSAAVERMAAGISGRR
ncbi:autophagy protein Apg6-domain-containing protein, partial [Dipodascopsis uninucleata]